MSPGSAYADRIASLAERARETRNRLDADSLADSIGDSVADSIDGKPDGSVSDGSATICGTRVETPEECALAAARDGLGPVIGVYVEARTADEPVRFSETEHRLLDRATNDWLAVYARCHGVEVDPGVTVRDAAEALIDTHDVTDVAAVLTGVDGD